jgi:predicted CXXCH cytochrome family protein
MIRTTGIVLLCMTLVFTGAVLRAEAALHILFPRKDIVVESGSVGLILEPGDQDMERIRIQTDGGGERVLTQVPGAKTLCIRVALKSGLNAITVYGEKHGTIIDRQTVQVYLKSRLFPAFRNPPPGFQDYVFHSAENEKRCDRCHDMNPALDSLQPAGPEKSPCYTCHKGVPDSTSAHYPAGQWRCFSCHELKPGKQKYAISMPEREVCFPCHSGEMKQWQKKRITHGPTAVGCVLCHNPHGSSWPSFLRMQTTDLCINCHHDKASGAHVIAGFYGKGHPVRGVPDPFKPDKEFTCASCHDPHAGDTLNLLRHNLSSLTEYCTTCHKM